MTIKERALSRTAPARTLSRGWYRAPDALLTFSKTPDYADAVSALHLPNPPPQGRHACPQPNAA